MPALKPTGFAGEVRWLGNVSDRRRSLEATACNSLGFSFDGPDGDAHAGSLRPACSRVSAQHPKGTPLRNTRQVAIVSEEELARIAAALGLPRLDPGWIGATICLAGLPDLSLLPPSSRLQAPDGATLVVDMQNRPCHLPDPVIRAHAGGVALARSFRSAARGLRGVTAWVEREGRITVGDRLRLHVPDQPAWPHLDAARTS